MISDVLIKNFKGIKNQFLEDLPPIVGIWGRNGTGKSSLLQAIVLAAKNRGNPDINGLNLGAPNNIVFEHNINNECDIEIYEKKIKVNIFSIRGGNASNAGKINPLIRYFPPWRHISKRNASVSKIIKSDLGYQADDTHTFLHWFLHDLIGRIARGDENAQKAYERINYWSEKIGYGKLLDQQIGNAEVMGTYNDPVFNFEIPLIDGGFGGNSFLTILLECYSFKNGIILIEEPEISLHPGAQGDIWEFMMEMVEEQNHQIIFTSHSPYLATKIARTLSEDKFKDKIHIYYTTKTGKGTEFELIPNSKMVERFEEYWGDIFPDMRGR